MHYKAIDISKYIINKCIRIGKPISNLKLQKILYYAQGEYLKIKNKRLFKDDIYAWDYGPCVNIIYYKFINYATSDIRDVQQEETEISKKDKKIIDIAINKCIDLSTWKLVENSQNESPWKKAYNPKMKNIISKKLLKKHFCKVKQEV